MVLFAGPVLRCLCHVHPPLSQAGGKKHPGIFCLVGCAWKGTFFMHTLTWCAVYHHQMIRAQIQRMQELQDSFVAPDVTCLWCTAGGDLRHQHHWHLYFTATADNVTIPRFYIECSSRNVSAAVTPVIFVNHLPSGYNTVQVLIPSNWIHSLADRKREKGVIN